MEIPRANGKDTLNAAVELSHIVLLQAARKHAEALTPKCVSNITVSTERLGGVRSARSRPVLLLLGNLHKGKPGSCFFPVP